MKQLRRLKDCELQKSIKKKQANGTYISDYETISKYKIVLQELIDQVSASVYGANINKTYRVSSPYNCLENFMKTKSTDGEDNISKYYLLIDTKRYKIVSVKNKYLDIELV